MTKPLLRWVGGKSRLVETLAKYVPDNLDVYFEPFCGSAALFFYLKATGKLPSACKVILADANEHLIHAYCTVRDSPIALVDSLHSCFSMHAEDPTKAYAEARKEWNAIKDLSLFPLQRAALFIYLNQTNYNGLYRVNAAGNYNVPCGRKEVNFRSDRIYVTSFALRNVTLKDEPFTKTLKDSLYLARSLKRFVYCDPPYLQGEDSDFTKYTADGFSYEDHVHLGRSLEGLVGSGVNVLVSNSLAGAHLYSSSVWSVEEVGTRYSVAQKGSARGAVRELLIRSSCQ